MASSKTVLCVDDDRDILDSLKVVLEANGYKVLLASSGEEGLRAFTANPPDAVIVDLMMEEIDAGTSLVKHIQALGGCVPIYILSSVGDSLEQTVDSAQLGLAGVFQKPIQASVLLGTLKAKLG